jgi:hypothetical protein
MTYSFYNSHPLEGSYSVRLYTPEGVALDDIGETMVQGEGNVIQTFKSLHYVTAINGMWAHGWGEYTIVAPMSQVSTKALDLDTVVHIYRKPPNAAWDVDFYGIHRLSNITVEGDSLQYTTSGFDLKSLLKRRVILPDDGSVPYTVGWYTLTNNIGAVYGIIPREFDTPPLWRSRYYSALCYEEAFDGDFDLETPETIIIAGMHGSTAETQRYLYIGCTGLISGIRFTFGTVNTHVATLWAQYFTTAGWNTLTGATDGTDLGGAPFGQNGEYLFTTPTDIIKGTGITTAGFGDIYWIRFTLTEDGDSVHADFTLKEVEVYGIPEVDTLRWASGTDHWTDIMRHLVRDQCITGSLAAGRQIVGLTCEADTHEGEWQDDNGNWHQLNLSYRYDNLADILEEISGMGADWDVIESYPGSYQFQVYYPEILGDDRTEDNTDNNTPVTFSLENGNIEAPEFTDDRTSEITVCYAVGKMINGKKKITQRLSLYDAQLASTWNRIESTVDSTTQDNEAAQLAGADSYLMDNTQKIEVSFKAKQTPNCLYGVHWFLGDMVGFYFNNHYYEMRVTQVAVDVDANGETIVPTIVRLPSLDYLYT